MGRKREMNQRGRIAEKPQDMAGSKEVRKYFRKRVAALIEPPPRDMKSLSFRERKS